MGRTNLQPLQKTNLREHIIEQLRSVIMDGTYQPGERLVEMAIAEQLQVSRAPVREALSALEQEGVVSQIARRGYFVVDFTEKDIEEVYSLRLLLEVEALSRAYKRVTVADFDEMQRLVDRLGAAAVAKKDPGEIVSLDLAFHEYVCCLADHSRLLSAWKSLRMQTRMLVSISSRTHYGQPEGPGERHQWVLDAMKTRELERAEYYLVDHIKDGQMRSLKALQMINMENGD